MLHETQPIPDKTFLTSNHYQSTVEIESDQQFNAYRATGRNTPDDAAIIVEE